MACSPENDPPTTISVETAYWADLAVIDVHTGVGTTIAQGYRPLNYWVSPTGSFVAFTSTAGMSGGGAADGSVSI